ncbi:MAG: ATP-binding protein, partial [Nocardioidaceae bacterium]
ARTALGTRDGVVLSDDTVALLPSGEVSVDVDRFDESAAASASSEVGTDHHTRLATAAVDRYRGDLLPDDLYEPWSEEARDRLSLRYLELLRQVGRWEELVAADPGDEDAHLRLIRRLALQGDRRAALRQFERMEKALQEELGVDPSDKAVALREEIKALPVDDAEAEAPTSSRVTPVPSPATRIIGRDGAIAEALAMLDQARILTFLGPGGVGKTTLAVEVALRRSESRSVEACFVDLTKVDDPALVPELVAGEFGIHRATGTNADQLLREALRGRSLLMVLDNFEHVIDAAGIVSRLVGWSPFLEVLSTSRARLQITDEQVFEVAPLEVGSPSASGTGEFSPGDAVALFGQVARAVDPHFDLARHLDDVTAICHTLDGLPLAIKLAAGHVRTLPPPLLRSRLGRRLGSPSGAARDSPSRQRTIPATIDWSLQLLGAPEQRLFTRLGVFAGPVGIDAVEAVCSDPGTDVVDSLERLVDQSLVRRVSGPGGESRFGMLELLRERARELLTGEEEDRVRARHARYVANMVDTLEEHRWTDAANVWIGVISDALAEIRAAHTWAQEHGEPHLAARITAGLGAYWHREGHHVEGRAWVDDALEHVTEYDDDLAARLLVAAGFVTWTRDRLTARGHWEESAERFQKLGDDRYLAYSLALLSGTYIGDSAAYGQAMRICDESVALARQVGERPLVAQALNVRGELARVQGDDHLALEAYAEGRDLAAAAHDEAHLTVFLANLSYLADHRGDYEEARRLGCEALRMCWSLGRRMMAAWTVSELAGPELGLGRPERGAVLVGAAEQALTMLGVSRHPGDVPEHKRVLDGLRQRLGEPTFRRLTSEGAEMSLHQAVLMALSDRAQDHLVGSPAAQR